MIGRETISKRDILRILLSHKLLLIVLPIFLTILAYITYELKTPQYMASVKMYVRGIKKTDFYYPTNSLDIVKNHSELLRTRSVLTRVINALRLDEIPIDEEMKYATPVKRWILEQRLKGVSEADRRRGIGFYGAMAMLSSNIDVSQIGESNIFYIQYSDYDPQRAVKVVNSLSRSYVIFDLEQQIEELKLKYGEKHIVVEGLQDYIQNFTGTLNGELLRDVETMGPATVTIVSQAESATKEKNVPKDLLLGFSAFTGLFLAITLIAIIEYYDPTIKKPSDIIRHFDLPFMGSLPKRKKKDMLIMKEPNPPEKLACVRAFQNVGDKIYLYIKENNIKTVLTTALSELNDASATIANLALYFSRDIGKRVLIIDTNLRQHLMGKFFNITTNPTLIDLYEQGKDLSLGIKMIENNLYILPSRQADFRPLRLFDSPGMYNLLERVKNEYDLIFLDANTHAFNDITPEFLAKHVDGIMLILTQDKDEVTSVDMILKTLKRKEGLKIFSVLNNRKGEIPRWLYKRI